MASFWLELKCGDIAEELGTRDVLKQVDTRPSNVVGDILGFRSGMDDRLNQMEVPVNNRPDRVGDRFDRILVPTASTKMVDGSSGSSSPVE